MHKLTRSFGPALNKIEQLNKGRRILLTHRGALNRKAATLRKSKTKGFEILVNGISKRSIDAGDELKFGAALPEKLKVTSAYCSSIGAKTSRGLVLTRSLSIRSLESRVNRKSKYYCRTILSIDENIPFYYMIDTMAYSHSTGSQKGMIKVSLLGENDYTIYCHSKGKKYYLVIDSKSKKSPENFQEECWSILVSLGYIQGYLPQDEEYLFYYNSKTNENFAGFSYRTLRDTLKTIYKPLYSNPYSWSAIPKKRANKYYKILQNLSHAQFSSLCRWTHAEIDIKAILLLILEATKTSLLTMPASLSVALEGLTEYFYVKNEPAFKPISNPKTSQDLIKELKKVLLTYETHPDVRSYSTLLTKVEQLNAPTNAEKLKAPFKILDIPLTKTDEETIDYRNDFLHGNINLKPRKGKKSYTMSAFEIALRLLTLLNALILKKVGYNGFILNHVKLQEGGIIKHIPEPYYKELAKPAGKY